MQPRGSYARGNRGAIRPPRTRVAPAAPSGDQAARSRGHGGGGAGPSGARGRHDAEPVRRAARHDLRRRHGADPAPRAGRADRATTSPDRQAQLAARGYAQDDRAGPGALQRPDRRHGQGRKSGSRIPSAMRSAATSSRWRSSASAMPSGPRPPPAPATRRGRRSPSSSGRERNLGGRLPAAVAGRNRVTRIAR
jgi:hypothetical protein